MFLPAVAFDLIPALNLVHEHIPTGNGEVHILIEAPYFGEDNRLYPGTALKLRYTLADLRRGAKEMAAPDQFLDLAASVDIKPLGREMLQAYRKEGVFGVAPPGFCGRLQGVSS